MISLPRLDLNDIRIITKSGGTIDDSEMVDGIVFDQKAAKAAGGPGRMEKAKVRFQWKVAEIFKDISSDM